MEESKLKEAIDLAVVDLAKEARDKTLAELDTDMKALCIRAREALLAGMSVHMLCVLLTPGEPDGLNVNMVCTEKAMLPAFATCIAHRAKVEVEAAGVDTSELH